MIHHIFQCIYPARCLLCEKVLGKDETDLCRQCRVDAPETAKLKIKISFVARYASVWYYKDKVRSSILHYKFMHHRGHAVGYARILAMKIQREEMDDFQILTWVPVSRRRKYRRGFDQVELLVRHLGRELGVKPVSTLKKIRHTQPQSTLTDPSHRRANVLGAYQVIDPQLVQGKRILLIDDVLTTGATASECAKTLLLAGAAEVSVATLAVAFHEKK